MASGQSQDGDGAQHGFAVAMVGRVGRWLAERPLDAVLPDVAALLATGPGEACRVRVDGFAEVSAGADSARAADVVMPLSQAGERHGELAVWTRRRPGSVLLDALTAVARMLADAAAIASLRRQVGDAAETRDQVLAVASHELRAPLSALKLGIDANLRRIRSTADVLAPDWMAARLEPMQRQVDNLAQLVERLFAASQDQVDVALECVEVDLAAVCREVVDRMQRELEWARCECRVDAPAVLLGRWDRVRIEQVVVNLLTNAIKYGSRRPIEVVLTATPTLARLTVRDHGVGIAVADQPRLFRRYERLSPPPGIPGLGLGLWICAQIVAAHDGRIAVVSAPGEGSSFVVELPRAPVLAVSPSACRADG